MGSLWCITPSTNSEFTQSSLDYLHLPAFLLFTMMTWIRGLWSRGRCRKLFFFQILSRHMYFFVFLNFKSGSRGCGKFPNLIFFAPFGLWKSWTKKVPWPVHKNQEQCELVFGCFVVVFVVVFVFFCMIWSNIIIFSPPEHRKHHLNLKWGGSIFWFRPISCTHFHFCKT